MEKKMIFKNGIADKQPAHVGLFKENLAGFSPNLVLWHLFKLEADFPQLVEHSPEYTLSVTDCNGNTSRLYTAKKGWIYTVIKEPSGDQIQVQSTGNPDEVRVVNKLMSGPISVNIFLDNKRVFSAAGVAPGMHANFSWNEVIHAVVIDPVNITEQLGSCNEGASLLNNDLPNSVKIEMGKYKSTTITLTGDLSSADELNFDINATKD